jgi:hypothetical protein
LVGAVDSEVVPYTAGMSSVVDIYSSSESEGTADTTDSQWLARICERRANCVAERRVPFIRSSWHGTEWWLVAGLSDDVLVDFPDQFYMIPASCCKGYFKQSLAPKHSELVPAMSTVGCSMEIQDDGTIVCSHWVNLTVADRLFEELGGFGVPHAVPVYTELMWVPAIGFHTKWNASGRSESTAKAPGINRMVVWHDGQKKMLLTLLQERNRMSGRGVKPGVDAARAKLVQSEQMARYQPTKAASAAAREASATQTQSHAPRSSSAGRGRSMTRSVTPPMYAGSQRDASPELSALDAGAHEYGTADVGVFKRQQVEAPAPVQARGVAGGSGLRADALVDRPAASVPSRAGAARVPASGTDLVAMQAEMQARAQQQERERLRRQLECIKGYEGKFEKGEAAGAYMKVVEKVIGQLNVGLMESRRVVDDTSEAWLLFMQERARTEYVRVRDEYGMFVLLAGGSVNADITAPIEAADEDVEGEITAGAGEQDVPEGNENIDTAAK